MSRVSPASKPRAVSVVATPSTLQSPARATRSAAAVRTNADAAAEAEAESKQDAKTQKSEESEEEEDEEDEEKEEENEEDEDDAQKGKKLSFAPREEDATDEQPSWDARRDMNVPHDRPGKEHKYQECPPLEFEFDAKWKYNVRGEIEKKLKERYGVERLANVERTIRLFCGETVKDFIFHVPQAASW